MISPLDNVLADQDLDRTGHVDVHIPRWLYDTSDAGIYHRVAPDSRLFPSTTQK